MSSLRNNYGRVALPPRNPFNFSLTDDGTQTGGKDAAVDGSVTPVDFFFTAIPTLCLTLNRIGCIISDVGNSNFQDYGSVTGPLANGVEFFVVLDGNENVFNTKVQRTIDYLSLGSSVNFVELSGSDRIVTYSFALLEYSQGVTLNGNRGDKFGVRINDNLTGLSVHECFINGYSTIHEIV